MIKFLLGIILFGSALTACTGASTTETPPTLQPTSVAASHISPTESIIATEQPTEVPTTTSATSDQPSIADPKEAILAAMANIQKIAHRTESTVTSETSETKIYGEIVPPSNIHSRGVTSGEPPFETEVIIIGDKMWSRHSGGDWAETVATADILVNFTGSPEELGMVITDVELLGAELVGSTPTFSYRYTATTPVPGLTDPVVSVVTMWIDAATWLPVQQQIEGEAMGIKSSTIQLITPDSTIQIEPPILPTDIP